MRLSPLTTVGDDLRTKLRSGLATVGAVNTTARTHDLSVMTVVRSPRTTAVPSPFANAGRVHEPGMLRNKKADHLLRWSAFSEYGCGGWI
jgi:hypothetical protein